MIKSQITKEISLILKNYNFSPKGNNLFICQRQQVHWLFDIQQSKWNNAQQKTFTCNCGIYVPGFWELYSYTNESQKLSVPLSCLSDRIGFLSKPKQDVWWDTINQPREEIFQNLSDRFQQAYNLFFLKFDHIEDIILFLTTERSSDYLTIMPLDKAVALSYAAVLYWLKGDKVKCILFFNEAKKYIRIPNSYLYSLEKKLMNSMGL